jgi:hypothetical protein
MPQGKMPKSFREAIAELVAKQYLPFSTIEEKEVLKDSYKAYLQEYKASGTPPDFVSDKTVASDIAMMAERYTEYTSKLSFTMDVWT